MNRVLVPAGVALAVILISFRLYENFVGKSMSDPSATRQQEGADDGASSSSFSSPLSKLIDWNYMLEADNPLPEHIHDSRSVTIQFCVS